MSRMVFAWIVVGAASCVAAAPLHADDTKKVEFFESRIRPVLIKHCYECHSTQSKEIKGGLLVDSSPGMLAGGDSGPSIVPGKPDESPLIEALRYDGFEMPPAGRLPQNIVADFEKWIEMGAPDPRTEAPERGPVKTPRAIDVEAGREFWAFQPVRSVSPAAVSDMAWPTTDIDTFVLNKLEAAGIRPAPDADARGLIRRLYFDLVGLPPILKEEDGKLKDQLLGIEIELQDTQGISRDALAQLADRLLESPQFGVHWGRHWLDVARYADSNGGDFNATFHNAWRYRDYVVDAFNGDKPFNEFVREQIAGDLLDSETEQQRGDRIVATGFLMLGAKMLSERDKLKLTMDVVDEQINTVGQAFMGLTLGCARCHDHKFDPIPTRDYYALAGIFRSTRTLEGESQQYVSTWPRRQLPASPEHLAAVKKYEANKRQLQDSLKLAKKQQDSMKKRIDMLRRYSRSVVVDDVDAKKTGAWKASTYSPNFHGKGYIHDDQSEKGEKWVEFTVAIPRSANYDVQLSYTPGSTRANNVPVSIRSADTEREVRMDQRPKPPIDDIYVSVGQFRFRKGKPGVVTVATRGTEGYVIVDSVRLIELDENGEPVRAIGTERAADIEQAKTRLERAEADVKRVENQLKALEAEAPEPLPKAIAVDEGKEIGDCPICVRGEHRNLGPVAPRGFLQVATIGPPAAIDESTSGRLELANWLASDRHPLTARVYVNRIWQHLIGQGIVASVDNFGHLGDRPSHPKLLDYLATEFMENGWSTKHLIRKIVSSHVYRISSQHNDASWDVDPENRLLWRAHRRRLPAEAIRDSILAISGQLDLSLSGSPVQGLGTLVTQNSSEQKEFEREASRQRSAYLPIIRAEIPPILAVFDFADPDLVTGRRSVTNVPAQALLLLNSPFVMEQAESAAQRVEHDVSLTQTDTSDRVRTSIRRTYNLVLAREPTEAEMVRASEFLDASNTLDHPAPAKADKTMSPLAQFIHALFASTEFRMVN